MIRTLGLLNAFRVAAASPPDVAALLTQAAAVPHPPIQGFAFLLASLRSRRTGVALVALERGKLLGMASVRRISGPTAWCVDHLALLTSNDAPLGELLEAASTYAGRRGAERLFLRLPDEWDIQKGASLSGFAPSHQALLLTLPGRGPLYQEEPLLNTRLRRPADDHALFRLRNACTPAEVRYKTGLTLQQWKDAEEPATRRTRELVLDQEGEAVAWLRLDYHRGWTKVRTLTLPSAAVDMPSLVAYVVKAGRRGILWEVPEYQADLHLLLERMGFEVSGCYRLMVKSLAPMVKKPAWAPALTSV